MLDNTKYVIRANQKMDWYIGFANEINERQHKMIDCAQNIKLFAFYFTEMEHATKFLNTYLEQKSISDYNRKYYEVIAETTNNVNNCIFMYDVPCYYDTKAYDEWKNNMDKYDTRKAFKK